MATSPPAPLLRFFFFFFLSALLATEGPASPASSDTGDTLRADSAPGAGSVAIEAEMIFKRFINSSAGSIWLAAAGAGGLARQRGVSPLPHAHAQARHQPPAAERARDPRNGTGRGVQSEGEQADLRSLPCGGLVLEQLVLLCGLHRRHWCRRRLCLLLRGRRRLGRGDAVDDGGDVERVAVHGKVAEQRRHAVAHQQLVGRLDRLQRARLGLEEVRLDVLIGDDAHAHLHVGERLGPRLDRCCGVHDHLRGLSRDRLVRVLEGGG
mmetsp:Transcript_15307/g.36288  ORF Transcript_15307/g.36288 Transcript_15307/m.36288 type:complete len:266 (-) Transcript_15307:952-1749(-)